MKGGANGTDKKSSQPRGFGARTAQRCDAHLRLHRESRGLLEVVRRPAVALRRVRRNELRGGGRSSPRARCQPSAADRLVVGFSQEDDSGRPLWVRPLTLFGIIFAMKEIVNLEELETEARRLGGRL